VYLPEEILAYLFKKTKGNYGKKIYLSMCLCILGAGHSCIFSYLKHGQQKANKQYNP
jgi:hypothetical protein